MPKPLVAMIANYPVGGAVIDGGVQAVSAYLVSGLLRTKRVDLQIITFSGKVTRPKTSHDGGVVVHILPEYRLNNLTGYRRTLRDLKTLLHSVRPDLVHGQGAGWEGYLAAKSGYPSVVTFHGIIGEDAKHASSMRDRFRLRLQSRIAERFCVLHAPNIVAISPYVRRYYGNSLMGTTRLIPNPIETAFFDVHRRKGTLQILFAGRLIPRKGVLDLISAVKAVSADINVSLRLAGSLEDRRYMAKVRRAISEHKLEDRVQFLGLLNQQQVLDEFGTATVLVLPSYQETAPMVIQQAMAARLPVIATDICGIPDQLDNGNLGWLFAPGDVDTLASHLRTCLTREDIRDGMARLAFEKARSEYHVEVVAEATVDFYHEVLGTPKDLESA